MASEYDQLLAVFMAEAGENLATIERVLLDVETRGQDDDSVHEIFRAAHTLKGNAACLGFPSLGAVAHSMENVLDGVRAGALGFTPELVSLLLEARDVFASMLTHATEGSTELPPAAREVTRRLGAFTQTSLAQPVAAALPQTLTQPAAQAARVTLRIDLEKLDTLLNLVGEISIARGGMLAAIRSLPRDQRDQRERREELLERFEEEQRLFSDLEDQTTRLRLAPIGNAFEHYRRTVRDLARDTGKELDLLIEGADVEIDASLIERVKDPITHMIRNAVSHGIEEPEVRRRAGKPSAGTITLRARQQGPAIIVEVADDGRGFGRDRILQRARERGMIAPGATLTDQEILALVFAPGFSTVADVTDLSGRGVGMDVVRRNVASMRGSVHIESREGEGSTIAVRLPLTLASIDGLVVGAGGERYVIPLQSVESCLAHSGEKQLASMIELEGSAVACFDLAAFLELGSDDRITRRHVVVVSDGARRIGLVVDELFGSMQTVIKPLGLLVHSLSAVAGSTVFPDGGIGLILDVAGIVRAATLQFGAPTSTAATRMEARTAGSGDTTH